MILDLKSVRKTWNKTNNFFSIKISIQFTSFLKKSWLNQLCV